MQTHPNIRWPPDLTPAVAHVHTINEIETGATVEQIWPVLIRATRWHTFYSNCRRLKIDGGGDDLAAGSRFHWWTFGVPVTTVVEDFVPFERLAWSGEGVGSRGYHAWIVERTADGTRVVTEETQRGAVVWMGRPLLRRGLSYFHQRWLEGLARAASTSTP